MLLRSSSTPSANRISNTYISSPMHCREATGDVIVVRKVTCSGYGVRDYSKAQRAKCVKQTKTGISTFRESSKHRNNQDRSFNPLRIKGSVLRSDGSDSPRCWGAGQGPGGKGLRIKDEGDS